LRVQIMSDLHLEFHADGGEELVAGLDPSGVDVLVLAGDVAVGDDLPAALARFSSRYADAQIVYVLGNHEYYGSSRPDVERWTRGAAQRHRNLHWLENRVVSLGGRRFVGATLWFPHRSEADPYRSGMSDFSAIEDFEAWVYDANERTVRWLERQLRPGDVVVTHHLPTHRAVSAEYAQSPLNPFFVCELTPLIQERRPALWCFGHTHAAQQFHVGDTLLVANPFGYPGTAPNGAFDPRLLVEL
jgi:predicted phosphodiesterase